MSGFTGNSLIVSLNSIVGNTETPEKKKRRENKIYCLPGEYWFSLHNSRDNTETLGKPNWWENKIYCLPREYWLRVHDLRDNTETLGKTELKRKQNLLFTEGILIKRT